MFRRPTSGDAFRKTFIRFLKRRFFHAAVILRIDVFFPEAEQVAIMPDPLRFSLPLRQRSVMSTVLKIVVGRRRFVQMLGAGLIVPRVAGATSLAHPPAIDQTEAGPASDPKTAKFISPIHHPIEPIHRILIVDGFATPKKISSILTSSMSSLKDLYPSANHTLWNGEALRSYIVDKFGGDVTKAFDRLKPYAYKADLGRYCLLFDSSSP